jgi:hypothetical protein
MCRQHVSYVGGKLKTVHGMCMLTREFLHEVQDNILKPTFMCENTSVSSEHQRAGVSGSSMCRKVSSTPMCWSFRHSVCRKVSVWPMCQVSAVSALFDLCARCQNSFGTACLTYVPGVRTVQHCLTYMPGVRTVLALFEGPMCQVSEQWRNNFGTFRPIYQVKEHILSFCHWHILSFACAFFCLLSFLYRNSTKICCQSISYAAVQDQEKAPKALGLKMLLRLLMRSHHVSGEVFSFHNLSQRFDSYCPLPWYNNTGVHENMSHILRSSWLPWVAVSPSRRSYARAVSSWVVG